ncbi:MAG: cyclase family protein [Thaumarchaeota archaeon]|nr:cyclase family protein [Nitrososphaerota archaeon]
MSLNLIDLSQSIHSNMQVFPTYPKPVTIPWAKRETYGYESEVIYMSSHTGTHIDAPYHFHLDGRRIDELDLDIFIRPGLLLNLTGKGAKEYISLSDLETALQKARSPVKGKAVLLHTGWSKHSGRKQYLTENPGLSKEAARYLVKNRAALVGIDAANIDHPSENTFPAHNTLLHNNIPIVENLCNLEALRQKKFRFIALPLKLKGATGSPVRAAAEILG